MSSRGLSLIEALVAMAILGIAAVAVLPAFMTQVGANGRSEARTDAITAAQQVLEGLRFAPPDTQPGCCPVSTVVQPAQTVTIGARQFQVVTTFCARQEYCGAGSRHMLVEVSLDGRMIYDVETVYTTFE